MDLNVLAKNIASAYSEIGFFPFVTSVLGGITQDNTRMDFVVFTDLRPASQIGMRHDSCATLDPHRAFDDHVRADLDFGVDCGLGIDHGRRMNAHENDNYPFQFVSPCQEGLPTQNRNSQSEAGLF